MMTRIALERTKYVPKELKPGILYVSEEYGVAAHLCACGCGEKVSTPLNPAGWRFTERGGKPSLDPSIGNWQLACKSHYVIYDGVIYPHGRWSEEMVLAGRQAEDRRRVAYYAKLDRERGFWARLWKFIRSMFGGK